MPLGVQVIATQAAPAAGAPTNTSTAFFVGFADMGDQTNPRQIQSISDFITYFGARSPTNALLFDACDTYFREGGAVCYIGRVTGPNPTAASVGLNDSASVPAQTLIVQAKTVGQEGNGYQARVVAANQTFTAVRNSGSPTLSSVSTFAYVAAGTPISGTGIPAGTTVSTFNVGAATITMSLNATSGTATSTTVTAADFTMRIDDLNGNPLETTGLLRSRAEAIAYNFSTVNVLAGSPSTGSPAAVGDTQLTGGADDRGNAVLADWSTALALFTSSYGPGQVAAPGQTETTLVGIWEGLLAHAQTYNRFALLDMDDAQPVATLIADISPLQTTTNASYGMAVAGSVLVPGITPTTVRTVPASAAVAGLCGRVDAFGNPNIAAAGPSWPLNYVVGFATTYQDGDQQTLNTNGVNTWVNDFGTLELDGFSTPVPSISDPTYWQASHSRLRMAIVAQSYEIGRHYRFAQIDGKGQVLAQFGGDLAGMLNVFYLAGALYGDTADHAFQVGVGPAINPPASLAAGKIKAVAEVKMSPFAQSVEIDLGTFPVVQALPVLA